MEKINSRSAPIPSKPSAKQITVEGNKLMVGGSEKTQSIGGLKNVVPDGSKGK